MALPRTPPKAKPQPKESGKRGYDNIATLLTELHGGVVELGENARVQVHDCPQLSPPTIGFSLWEEVEAQKTGVRLCTHWEFAIEWAAFSSTKSELSAGVRDALGNFPGRANIAELLQQGVKPTELEQALRGS